MSTEGKFLKNDEPPSFFDEIINCIDVSLFPPVVSLDSMQELLGDNQASDPMRKEFSNYLENDSYVPQRPFELTPVQTELMNSSKTLNIFSRYPLEISGSVGAGKLSDTFRLIHFGEPGFYRMNTTDISRFKYIPVWNIVIPSKNKSRKERRIIRRAKKALNLTRIDLIVYTVWTPRIYCVWGN